MDQQQQSTVEDSVIQDLGIQLANLTIQKAFAEGQAKRAMQELAVAQQENRDLRARIEDDRDSTKKQPGGEH